MTARALRLGFVDAEVLEADGGEDVGVQTPCGPFVHQHLGLNRQAFTADTLLVAQLEELAQRRSQVKGEKPRAKTQGRWREQKSETRGQNAGAHEARVPDRQFPVCTAGIERGQGQRFYRVLPS